jgi:hypothetical protein
MFNTPKSKADSIFYKDADTVPINASTKPVKVAAEINRENKSQAQIVQELTKALKKAGAKVEPSLLDKLVMKNKVLKQYQQSKLNKAFAEEF